MSEKANFRRADIEAVYDCTDSIREFMEGRLPKGDEIFDPAHIMGRNRGDPVYSSIYNFAWLSRSFHASGNRDHRHIRAFLLEQAQDNVNRARAEGRYEMKKVDIEFLALANKWYCDTFLKLATGQEK